jgi:hypothetical protein
MSDSVLDDKREVREYWLAIAMLYAGVELYGIGASSKLAVFTFIVPEFDLQAYKEDYFLGKLAVADVKALGNAASSISQLLKQARGNGGRWKNPDYIFLERN